MDAEIADKLLLFIGFVILSTFHEFGHAWMAWKCGDDTARLLGRVSLNPLVHIDPIGTVLFPLIGLFSPGGFLLGWAKPVPINLNNLKNRNRDDVLITAAGPWMNLMLAIVLVGLAKIGIMNGSIDMTHLCLQIAQLSMFLFFFNLLPIPPLDGSHIARVIVGMTYETYYSISRFGFLALFVIVQIPAVQSALVTLTLGSMSIITGWFGM